MEEPKVTVLMTVYNGGDYLKTSIASILNQTFRDFEFLIVNDCSRDHSVEIIRSYSDERIRLVTNEVNLGQTRSLNRGLSLARGKYIARMDSDDLAFPDWLKTQATYLDNHPGCVVVSCRGAVMDGAGRMKKILNTPLRYDDMILKSLTASPINHVGSLYDRTTVLDVGGYDENFKIAADYELWSKLIRNGPFDGLRETPRLASTDEVLVAIRVHENSLSITERGRTDLKEISDIMTRNFQALTTSAFKDEDVVLLWKLFYAVEQLSDAEFLRGQEILTRAYTAFRPGLPFDPGLVRRFLRRQRLVIFTKRIFFNIKNGNSARLRPLAWEYVRREGFLNFCYLVWLLSWGGISLVKALPVFYEKINIWRTKIKFRQYRHVLSLN